MTITTTSPTARRLALRQRRCRHVPVVAVEGGGPSDAPATGHVVGRVYFSRHYGMHYVVQSRATMWQLAPEAAVSLLWENGNTTVMSDRHTLDPICIG